MDVHLGSTKESIIELLSYEWPMSMKKIYALLKKKGFRITYQAIHKAVSQLVVEKKLNKTSDGYVLNLEWVKSLHDQTEIIRVNYFSKKRSFISTEENNESSIRVFVFESWFDLEKYLYYLQKKTLLKSKNRKTICVHHHHEWRPLFYLRAEYNWINTLKKNDYLTYTLCSGKSVVDTWAKKFYSNLGNKLLLDSKIQGPAEIIVFDDLLIEVYVPFELISKLDTYLKTIKHLEDINNTWLIENIFEVKTDIKLIIHRDEKLADVARKTIMSKFKK